MERTLSLGARSYGLKEIGSELYRYRILVGTLVSRELKARYRGSLLGFLWTVLNPLLLMAVYTLVFRYYMRIAVENYAVFLLSGLLPWVFFASALSEGANSILSGGSLITKSLFPPHVLPTVTVLAHLVHYLLALPVLLAFILGFGIPLHWTIVFLPLVLGLQALFTWGLVLMVAALNVHFRDTQHILGNVILLWFFLCPIIYPVEQIPPQFRFIHFVNPMGHVIEAYHNIFLYGVIPSLKSMLGVTASAAVMLFVGIRVFESYRETFAELV